jgi:glycosyltransferase involved in cell wall biosynthesis
MRILHIIYNLSSGGAERFVVDLANQLADFSDNEVFLLTLLDDSVSEYSFYKSDISNNISYLNLRNKKINWKIFFQINKMIRKIQPDIVNFHLSPIILYSLLPIFFWRTPVYIETIHNEVSQIGAGKKLVVQLKYFLYRLNFIKVCTISDRNSQEFERIVGKKCDIMIYNGRKKVEGTEKLSDVKNEIALLKLTNSTLVFTHVGRCAHQKNQILLLKAFNKIVKEGVDAILLIIGNGFDSELGRMLQQYGSKRIKFLGQKRNSTDYLFNSDAFCLSSLYEGMPITLIESFACGTIPLSTPVSGVVDLVINEENGFVAKDFSVEGYVEMMQIFIKKHKNIKRESLIKLYYDKLSIESCAEKYNQFYKKCLERSDNVSV